WVAERWTGVRGVSMNARAQQACVLSGLVLVVLFYLGFWVISGFLIPLPPNSSADVVAQMFARDQGPGT
ncbi:MAG: hypothetical protein QOG76_156, partial [Pseudonocardiales bacterium]|nr:hypothetical protein [Pseudonocardiales bacterium]